MRAGRGRFMREITKGGIKMNVTNSNFYNNMSQLGGKSKLASKGITDSYADGKRTRGGDKSKYDSADFTTALDKAREKSEIRAEKSEKTTETTKLSETAQGYLEKLKEKFPEMDFIVADFSTDEEADKLLSQGKGEYNVLLTPDLLEKMAADKDTAAKYEGIIKESTGQFTENAEQLDDYRQDIADKYGVSVDSSGKVNYYALLKDGLSTDDGETRVKADSMQELLDKLGEIREKRKAAAETAEDEADEKLRTSQEEYRKHSRYDYSRYGTASVKDAREEVEEAVSFTV